MKDTFKAALRRASCAAMLGTPILAGCATGGGGALPEQIVLGRDANDEPCRADRSFKDADQGPFEYDYAIGCRGVTASRTVGAVSRVPVSDARREESAACGAASTVPVAGIGPVEARRCFDTALNAETIVVEFQDDGYRYRGSAVPAVVGPMEQALRVIARRARPPAAAEAAAPSVAFADLAAAPAPQASAAAETPFDPENVLEQGIALNRQGRYIDASRILNDALGRMPPSTPAAVRAEIALEAGLADSNIRFRDSAAQHFELAASILRENPDIARAAFLERKRTTYSALDALNRRDWNRALAVLSERETLSPLEDPAILAATNQAPEPDGDQRETSAVIGLNQEQLAQVVIGAQREWAMSVAELARGGPNSEAASEAALRRAADRVRIVLNEQINPASVLWLTAMIERHGGRLQARRGEGEGSAADYRAALARFDCALAALEGTRPPDEQACTIPLGPTARARLMRAGGGSDLGPIIADAQMERASLLRRAGVAPAQVLADYDRAVDALLAANRRGGTVPSGLEEYLDLLASEAQSESGAAAADRYFRAIQAIGEPETARQMSQLQAIVTGDGATAAKVRDRNDLSRDIRKLRYEIASEATDEATRARLEAERARKEQELFAVQAALSADRSLSSVDDRPVTISEIQAALEPGEVYWKLSELRARLYGIVISKDRATVYAITEPTRRLDDVARVVRASITGGGSKIPVFQVAASAQLFQLLAGPAAQQLATARSIVVDGAGPLDRLPAGVLVTDLESARAYVANRRVAPYDYSKVAFLAARSGSQSALSPRSFLESRKLPNSDAPNPFIGFGEHSVSPPPRLASAQPVSIGLGCPIEYQELVRINAQNNPISAEKIDVAASALGFPNAPRVTGAAFTDTALEQRGDLDDYKVLHFATHGLPETRFGCASIPPSLVTSIGGEGSDGFLSFDEIARLPLDANLVVLSACETSAGVSSGLARRSGQEEGGKALAGLVRAFLTAGARSVLATYWRVSVAEESDALMSEFYSRGRSQNVAEALRGAQLSLIRQPRYSHPYYWGAYFVVGDASKQMLAGPVGAGAQ